MGDEVGPRDGGGDQVSAEVDEATADDMHTLLQQAEAEAAKAEAAAAAARQRLSALQSGSDDPQKPTAEQPRRKATSWFRIRAPRRSVVAKTLAALVIIGSLVCSGVIVYQHHQASVRHRHADEFAAAAGQGITALTSLDFRNAKQDVQRIIDNSTGSFRDEYEVRADDFVKVVEASKVIARGTVTTKAVQSMTDDEATVLVAASEEITNAAGNKEPRAYRFRVTVTRDGDQLKLSKVELVP